MANTMTLIQSVTVPSGGSASIDFTSIPNTYTDLCLKMSIRAVNDVADSNIRFNGSTTGYNDRWLYADTTTAASTTNSAIDILVNRSTYTSSTFANSEIYIPNYAGSAYKSVSADSVTENNSTAALRHLDAGLWSNTAAINQVTILMASGNIAQYSTAYLYGVKSS